MTGFLVRAHVPVPRAEAAPPSPVLLLIDSLDGGGAERYVVDLAVGLRRRGWPVHVACSVGGVRAQAPADAGIPVSELLGELVERRISGRYERAVRNLVQEIRPAVVHAHLFASATAAMQALEGSRLPLVVTEHTQAPWRDRRARDVSQLVYRRADHLIAVSSAIRNLLVGEEYGIPPQRVEILLPATTMPVTARRSSVAGPPLIGVVAPLVPEKGIDVFLRAVALVSAVVPSARFLVVGRGPLRPELEQRAANLGVTPVVTFTGLHADDPPVVAGLEVLIVPSRCDGSPLVVCEAMAAGVPVVASRVGGLPELVEDGGSGLLVRPEDPEDLARAIVTLLLDPDTARWLGARGQVLAATRSHAALVGMTQVYAALVERPR